MDELVPFDGNGMPGLTAAGFGSLATGEILGAHRIEDYEIDLVIGGAARFGLNGGEIEVGAGDLRLYRPGDRIGDMRVVGSTPLSCYYLKFSWPMAEGGAAVLPCARHRRPSPARYVLLQERCQRIVSAWGCATAAQRLAAAGEIALLLAELAAPPSSATNATEARLAHALSFVELGFRDRLTIPRIAASCGMSADSFSRAFARHLGRPPMAYLIERRLAEARRLLVAEPDCQIATVAARSGFADLSHFGRLFRRQYGMSPSAFRAIEQPRWRER